MITQSFIMLPGVNNITEKRIWSQGIRCWDDLLISEQLRGVSKERLSFWKTRIRHAKTLLETDNGPRQLARLLGTRNTWRLFSEAMSNPRFIDIETTEYHNQITVVGVSDGEFYQAFIKGRNLDGAAVRRALAGASCIITFNGSSFDLPIIERNFPGAVPEVPHFDLRHICAQAGLHGGLKKIERDLQIRRPDCIRETDGADAIMLWYRYLFGEEKALQELIDYNAADVLNMVPLSQRVIHALWEYERHGTKLPFTQTIISDLNNR